MIRIQASGGLGNQLFIWNLAHNLEALFKCEVIIYYPTSKSDRKCELLFLKKECTHKISIVESQRLNIVFGFIDRLANRNKKITKILKDLLRIYETNLPSEIIEFKSRKPKLIRGYFQSPEFVEKNIDLYLKEIINSTDTVANSSELLSRVTRASQVMHIRRGDFIFNWEEVGLLSISYFTDKLEPYLETIIFTDASKDDSEVIYELRDAQVFGNDRADTWTSFSLMTFAKKLIVSNSTFSWWSGFIALQRGGEVVAPTPWTRTEIYGQNYLEYERFTRVPSDFYGEIS